MQFSPSFHAVPEPAPALSPRTDKLLMCLLAVFGFVLPLSTAAVSIGMALILVFALALAPALWRAAPWRDPVAACGLALLVYLALHTALISGLDARALEALNRYHELLLCVLLLGLFRLVSRPQAFLCGLALGTLTYAAAHWLALGVPALAAYLNPRYISAGFVMSVTAFVLFDRSLRDPRPLRLQVAAAFLAATVAFTIMGRTGQVVMALLAAYAAWTWAPRRWRVPGAAAAAAVLLGLAFTLGAVHRRVPETLGGVQHPTEWTQSATGIRVGLLASALETARHHFIVGVGLVHVPDFQEQSVRKLAQTQHDIQPDTLLWLRADNPHNEYLMQLISGGVVALALFVAWLLLPLARRHAGRPVPSLVALSLAFAAASAVNSLLLDFVEAHFHAALLAWLLAQYPHAGATLARTDP